MMRSCLLSLCGALACGVSLCGVSTPLFDGNLSRVAAQESPAPNSPVELVRQRFKTDVRPLLNEFCVRCHNVDDRKSGIRVDDLDGSMSGRRIFLWKEILEQIADEAMPPADEAQPTADQRRRLTEWIEHAIAVERTSQRDKNGSVRRLTVAQYRNTLRDLLGIDDDLTQVLPPDAVSKDGFVNNQQTLQLSPLLLEAYFSIAEEALERCLVDESSQPEIQNFRVDLGAAINKEPCPDKLVLGALNHLLRNEDFVVTQLTPAKPFPFKPFFMRTKYRFIEGYQGNDTVRGWRDFDSIYHSVFACMRGTEGYPKGLAYEAIPDGLLLRPAIPSAELFQVESTYGPKANFKISLRELPDRGRFRVTVRAARYDDGLLLDRGAAPQPDSAPGAIRVAAEQGVSQDARTCQIERAGVYQVDVYLPTPAKPDDPAGKKPPNDGKPQRLTLKLGERHFSGQLEQPAFLVVRLPAGPLSVHANHPEPGIERIVLTPLEESQPLAGRFLTFEKRLPRVGVHLGLRRDCGSTLTPVGKPQPVAGTDLVDYRFEGAISNFPSPDVEKDNVNYLAGIREIGVRSEYTDGRDMPRLLIRTVEFEGPLYEQWPPASHHAIFIDSPHKSDPAAYAREVLTRFATRAFRRPATPDEVANLLSVWKAAHDKGQSFRDSVKDALLVVLTSPQFVFQVENSASPKPEPLAPYELASKLSYFLWNAAPDERLLSLAQSGTLRESLDTEITRLITDSRFDQFTHEFASQWLSLDKLDVVEVDRKRYPKLTRDAKAHLRQEPVQLLKHLIRNNLPLRNLVQSDFIVANEVVASYYDLGDRTEHGFDFVAIPHGGPNLGGPNLGGLLTQAGILAGLSDGRESNPVKRGAWIARKIVAEPPDDPPPNVPALPKDDGAKLTLREKLERHRNQEGCAKCHGGIDPWGLPLEQFDAGGLFKKGPPVDARSKLPDSTDVADAAALKAYLAEKRLDQVAFGFLQHLATYATGRSLTYNEIELLREKGLELRPSGYRLQDMIRFVVQSEIFLEK